MNHGQFWPRFDLNMPKSFIWNSFLFMLVTSLTEAYICEANSVKTWSEVARVLGRCEQDGSHWVSEQAAYILRVDVSSCPWLPCLLLSLTPVCQRRTLFSVRNDIYEWLGRMWAEASALLPNLSGGWTVDFVTYRSPVVSWCSTFRLWALSEYNCCVTFPCLVRKWPMYIGTAALHSNYIFVVTHN